MESREIAFYKKGNIDNKEKDKDNNKKDKDDSKKILLINFFGLKF